MPQAASTFPAHHSPKSKYYSIIFILILAVPISILLFLFLDGPLFFTITMSAVLLGVFGLIVYFAISSSKTQYQTTSTGLRVNFGLLKKDVPYSKIAKAEVTDITVSLRLFGASLPGFHWGLFRTSIGNLHLYATKIDGPFLVLTLTNGEKYAFSPQDADSLLDTLEQNCALFGIQTSTAVKRKEENLTKLLYLQVGVVCAVYAIYLCYFFWVYVSLPQTVPLHFGFDGVANRFGDKSELLWLTGLTAMLPVINAVLTLKFGKHERGFVLLLCSIFVVMSAVFFYVTYSIVALM